MSSQPPIKGPLETQLEPVLDDARIQAIARGVQAARHAPRPAVAPRFVFAAAAAVSFLLVWWALAPREPQPLALADGSALAGELEARSLRFSDGSTMSLDEQAQAEVVANQPGKLTMLVRRGKARFEVNPGGHRQWLVEAGLATVEVVGTIFTVERGADGVRVSVERGTVVVRSDQLPDHLVRLEAGHSQFVGAPRAAVAPTPVPVPVLAAPSVPPAEQPEPVEAARVAPKKAPAWQPAAAAGDFATAWAALERGGFEATVRSTTRADELLALADTARSTGHDLQAAVALERLLTVAPADPGAATAAFTLGRLELEKLNRPGAAATHFGRAAASPGVGPLAEDALARRVEALVAAGDSAQAQAAARQLIERFPDGAHAARLRVWLAAPGRLRP